MELPYHGLYISCSFDQVSWLFTSKILLLHGLITISQLYNELRNT